MKKMRRFAAIAAAAAMTACMAVPMMTAFADAGDNSIKISAGTDDKLTYHTSFAAYQVFDGTYNATEKNLTIEGWGNGVNVNNFLAAIKADATLAADFAVAEGATDPYVNTAAGAVAVANVVKGYGDDSDKSEAFAKLAAKNAAETSGEYLNGAISGIGDGYYVVVDTKAATNTENKGTGWSLGMLEVAGGEEVTVTTKVGYPTVVKKVQEDDITTDEDYGPGYNDVADWDVNTPVPFKIQATMPENIDDFSCYYMKFTDTMADNFGAPTNIKVTVGGTDVTEKVSAAAAAGTNDLVVEITNLKALGVTITKDTVVEVTYTAVLNNTGTTAVIGLNGQENKVYLEYSNNPNVTATGAPSADDTGKTPEDTVIVFTYELDITKIDGVTKEMLQGAEFLLENADGKYAKVENDYFVAWVDKANATTLTSDESGVFKIIGLDDGTYNLWEQDWSDVYNIPTTAFVAKIDATTLFSQTYKEAADTMDADDMLTALTGTVGGEDAVADVNAGTVAGTIENNQGTSLPSTGGIGTTLFYVIGGTLAAGAGVALIAKKRMKNEE